MSAATPADAAAAAVVAAAALASASPADATMQTALGGEASAAPLDSAPSAAAFADLLQAQMNQMAAAYNMPPNMHFFAPHMYTGMAPAMETTPTKTARESSGSPTSDTKRSRWTHAEDEQLKAAVLASGGRNWKAIAQSAFGAKKTDVQCLHRWQKVLDPKLVKGPWTAEEDAKVVSLVAEHGPQKWSLIASHLPGRIGKQCRERWHNHLNPNIKKEAWTPEEDQILMLLQQRIGSQWALMTKYLPGRPDNSIKNRFNSSMKRKYAASGAALAVPDADGMINLPGFGLVALPTPGTVGNAKADDDDGDESDEEVKTATKKKSVRRAPSATKAATKRETASATKAASGKKAAARPSARKSLAAATAAAAAAVVPPPTVSVTASGRPRRAAKKAVQSESESDDDADRTDDERKDNHAMEQALDRTDDDTSDVDDDLPAGVFVKEMSASAHVPSTPAHQRSNGARASRHGRDSTTNLLQTPRNSLLSTPQNRNHSRASSHSSGSNGLKGLQMSYDSTPLRGKMSSPTLALSLASPSARELLSSPAISSAQLFSPPAIPTLQRLRPLSTPLTHQRYHNMMAHSQRTPGIMPASPGHLLSVPMGPHSGVLGPPQTPSRVMSLLASPSAFISTPAGAKLEHQHINEELASSNVGGGAAHAADASHADSDEPALKKQRTQLTSPTPNSLANSNGANTPYLSAASSSFLSARPLLNTPLLRFTHQTMSSTPSIGGGNSSASTLRTHSLSLTTPSPSFDSFFQQSPMRASRRGKRGLEFGADELATPASARSAASHESPVGFASPPPVRDHLLPTPMTDVPLCHVQQSNLLPAGAVSPGGAIGPGMGAATVNALLRELRQSAAAAAVGINGRSSSNATAEPSTPAHASSPLEPEATPRVPGGGVGVSSGVDTPDAPVSSSSVATAAAEHGPIPSFDHAAINELRVEGKGLTLSASKDSQEDADGDMPRVVTSSVQSKLLATPVTKKSVRARRTQDVMGSPSLNMLAACCTPVVTSS